MNVIKSDGEFETLFKSLNIQPFYGFGIFNEFKSKYLDNSKILYAGVWEGSFDYGDTKIPTTRTGIIFEDKDGITAVYDTDDDAENFVKGLIG